MTEKSLLAGMERGNPGSGFIAEHPVCRCRAVFVAFAQEAALGYLLPVDLPEGARSC